MVVMAKDTTDASPQQLIPTTIPSSGTTFGSRALLTVHRNCVICDDQFTIESRVMWREESQRYAHREHFEEPIPEPPGWKKTVTIKSTIPGGFDPEDTEL